MGATKRREKLQAVSRSRKPILARGALAITSVQGMVHIL
jgi:hypothetical protein